MASKEPWRPALEHLPPGTQHAGTREQGLPEWHQVILVPAGPVEEQ